MNNDEVRAGDAIGEEDDVPGSATDTEVTDAFVDDEADDDEDDVWLDYGEIPIEDWIDDWDREFFGEASYSFYYDSALPGVLSYAVSVEFGYDRWQIREAESEYAERFAADDLEAAAASAASRLPQKVEMVLTRVESFGRLPAEIEALLPIPLWDEERLLDSESGMILSAPEGRPQLILSESTVGARTVTRECSTTDRHHGWTYFVFVPVGGDVGDVVGNLSLMTRADFAFGESFGDGVSYSAAITVGDRLYVGIWSGDLATSVRMARSLQTHLVMVADDYSALAFAGPNGAPDGPVWELAETESPDIGQHDQALDELMRLRAEIEPFNGLRWSDPRQRT